MAGRVKIQNHRPPSVDAGVVAGVHGFDAITVSNQTAIAHAKEVTNSIRTKLKKIRYKLPY